MRSMTKSPLRIARNALAAGEAALPSCGSRFSRHDFTRPQLFALLVLRQFLRTDYRGIVALAAEWQDQREALKLDRVPHYSTLGHAAPAQAPPRLGTDGSGQHRSAARTRPACSQSQPRSARKRRMSISTEQARFITRAPVV